MHNNAMSRPCFLLFRQLAALLASVFLCAATRAAPPTLTVALGQDKPPYTISSPPGGIEYDLVSAVVVAMGYRPNILFAPNARAQLMLAAGSVDAAIGNSGPYVSRPYIVYQNVAIKLRDRYLPLERMGDLAHYRVTAFQNAHLYLGKEFASVSASNKEYREASPQQSANRQLYRHRTDVVISDANIFQYLNRQIAQEVDTGQPVTMVRLFPPTKYRLQFRDAELCKRFDQALQRVWSSGLYEQLAQRYLAPSDAQGTPYFKPPRQ
jgi:polar amino acid transport system substrate-binding protein